MTRRRHSSLRFSLAATGIASLLAAAAPVARAQSLASRVDNAPDGRVQFSFAARAGVCGGHTYIQTGPNSYSGTFYGNMTDVLRTDPCLPGPVRVVIDRAGKVPLSVQAYIGAPDSTQHGITDLGRVRAQEAAEYLLSIASTVDGRAGRDALFPASLADSANIAPALLAVARNVNLPRETRRSALSYLGRSTDGMQTIPSSVIDPLVAMARDESDNQSVRQQALSVLARLDHGAGIPPLVQLANQTDNGWLARESISALSRSGDPRARQFVRTAVRRTDLPDDVLAVVVRALGQDYATAQDAALLRDVYPTLKGDRSREAAMSALAEMGGAENTRWLLGIARNDTELLATRRRALDAASRSGAPITELIGLYDTTTDPGMKQTLIGIYIRNGERPAVDKLVSILKGEENSSVRRNAINQLSRSDDPRIRAALQDLVTR
jgi:HEAT repeat protein